MPMLATLQQHLADFDALAAAFPGPIPDSLWVPGNPKSGSSGRSAVAIGCLIHGNEVGSLPGVLAWVHTQINSKSVNRLPTDLLVFLGNRNAALQNQRFLEQDLNRMFHAESLDCHETRRAREIKTLLSQADLFLDFHQTIQPTKNPFYIFGYDRPSLIWAQLLSGGRVTKLVTRQPDIPFSQGLLCADEYVRSQFKKPAVTIELSQKGFSESANACVEGILDQFSTLCRSADKLPVADELEILSEHCTFTLDCYEVIHRIPFDPPDCQLNPGICNFQRVEAGETIGRSNNGPIHVPCLGDKDSRMLQELIALFPKYPARDQKGHPLGPLPGELICFAREIGTHRQLEAWLSQGL